VIALVAGPVVEVGGVVGRNSTRTKGVGVATPSSRADGIGVSLELVSTRLAKFKHELGLTSLICWSIDSLGSFVMAQL